MHICYAVPYTPVYTILYHNVLEHTKIYYTIVYLIKLSWPTKSRTTPVFQTKLLGNCTPEASGTVAFDFGCVPKPKTLNPRP